MRPRVAKPARWPVVSLLIGLAVAGVSAWVWSRSVYPLDAEAALAHGGRGYWPIAGGEVWRLLSAAFLHHDGAQLAWNLIPAIPLMALLERRVGAAWTTTLVVSGAIFGHGLGAAFSPQATVGFSPALFAVTAAAGLVVWRPHPRLARLILVYTAVGLSASLRLPAVDATSHFGGALACALGAAAWLGAKPLGFALLLPAATLFGLPPAMPHPSKPWRFDDIGLEATIDEALANRVSQRRRCTASGDFCLEVFSKSEARRSRVRPWSERCSGAIDVSQERCTVAVEGGLCVEFNRGLYDQRICGYGEPALLTHFSGFLRRVEIVDPKLGQGNPGPLLRAVSAHRLGRIEEARQAYREAMNRAPHDAKAPFLAALLELDFGEGPSAAEPLALRAVQLDPLHPDGQALLDELRGPP